MKPFLRGQPYNVAVFLFMTSQRSQLLKLKALLFIAAIGDQNRT